MKATGLTAVIIVLVVAISWITNFVKLTECDFNAPYKCEAIHAFGLIPAVSPVTVWFGVDK